MAAGDVVVHNNIIVPPTSGLGVKRMATAGAPGTTDDGWDDLMMLMWYDTAGGDAPSPTPIRGTGTNARALFFSAADKCDVNAHWNHDLVPNTDVYLHVHWLHPGTSISGTLTVDYYLTYAKGHQQATFPAEKQVTVSHSVSIGSYPQYQHNISEVLLATTSPTANQFDRSLMEVDGCFQGTLIMGTLPTISGAPAGSANEIAIIRTDLHYRTTGIKGTKNRSPSFY